MKNLIKLGWEYFDLENEVSKKYFKRKLEGVCYRYDRTIYPCGHIPDVKRVNRITEDLISIIRNGNLNNFKNYVEINLNEWEKENIFNFDLNNQN